MDLKWLIWQAIIPLASPLIVWFVVCWGRSSLESTQGFGAHLRTWRNVIEERGGPHWLDS